MTMAEMAKAKTDARKIVAKQMPQSAKQPTAQHCKQFSKRHRQQQSEEEEEEEEEEELALALAVGAAAAGVMVTAVVMLG